VTCRKTGAPSIAVANGADLSSEYESPKYDRPSTNRHERFSVGLLDRRTLREHTCKRLVRLLDEIDVKLAKLGRPGDEIFNGGFQVFTLYLRRLVESLRAEKPFPSCRGALERLLRVINNFSRYRLGALR
jgi:hypothetical protein